MGAAAPNSEWDCVRWTTTEWLNIDYLLLRPKVI